MKEEWKAILSSTWIKVVLIAIMVIPVAYAGIFLGSMWDPYGNADKIPVAVVNQDKAVNYQGASLHIGDDLVNNLKENKAMEFHFTKQKEANEGLKDGSYYMVITIPEKFSYNATTLLNEHPVKMELTYVTNPGTNYIASKMDESAVRKIKESVSATVTNTYADTLFSQVKTLSNGLADAKDGSQQLHDGVDETWQGNRTIEENLMTLASSTLSFKDGSTQLENGLVSYTAGVQEVNGGAQELHDGIQKLTTQSTSLLSGISLLQAGSSSLSSGVKDYTKGVDDVADGLDKLAKSNTALTQGMLGTAQATSQVETGSKQLLDGVNTISYTLNTVLSDASKQKIANLLTQSEDVQVVNSTWITTLEKKITDGTASDADVQLLNLLRSDNTILQASNSTITSLQTGLGDVQEAFDHTGTTSDTMGLVQGMTTLTNGISALNQGVNGEQGLKNGVLNYSTGVMQLAQGSTKLKDSSATLNRGASQVQEGSTKMNENAPSLQSGVKQLFDGSTSLYDGTNALVQNNPMLLSGIAQLQDGSVQLHDGANQLANGSTTLGNGLLQLKDGSSILTSSLQDGAAKSNIAVTEETKDMLSQPLEVTHQETTTVESNGKAMAPYMMSVGLYVACMAFTLMYPLLENHSKTKSGWKLWLSKASVMYALSTLMACIMILVLTLINGLSPMQFFKTLLVASLISAAFMSMIVFFNITCGKIGAFLVLIFMVFQLGGAAGTYPIETSSGFYQAIHPFMPFSYSVDAFRHTLALGGSILPDCFIFCGMILVFSACSIVFYRWKVSIPEEQFNQMKLAQFH